jgi:hypothetical protein
MTSQKQFRLVCSILFFGSKDEGTVYQPRRSVNTNYSRPSFQIQSQFASGCGLFVGLDFPESVGRRRSFWLN